MTTTEAILQHLESLPDSARQEVLDFVEFLKARPHPEKTSREDHMWDDFSLESAMRGMENEDSPYTLADLKETFR